MTFRGKNRRGGLDLHALDYVAAVGIFTYATSATITPIALIIIARELSFSLAAGGGIEVVRGGLILFALVGSGFAAARWGKPVSLGLSCLVLGGGLLLYSVAPVYGAILLAVSLLGLGGGILEGLINPLVHDLHPSDSGRYLNFINGFWSVGVLLTMLVTGDLLTREISWRWITGSLGVISLASGFLFLWMGRKTPATGRFAASEVWGHKWTMIAMPRFWIFMAMMFVAGAGEGAFTFWTASFIQLHHDALPRAGGIGTALFACGMVLGRFGSGIWLGQHLLRRAVFLCAIGGGGLSVWIPFIGGLTMVFVALFLAGLSVACFWPSLQSYAADRLPVESTSLFVLLSCAGIPGFAFASGAIGYVGDKVGLQAGFLIVPFFFGILAMLLAIEGVWRPTKGA